MSVLEVQDVRSEKLSRKLTRTIGAGDCEKDPLTDCMHSVLLSAEENRTHSAKRDDVVDEVDVVLVTLTDARSLTDAIAHGTRGWYW